MVRFFSFGGKTFNSLQLWKLQVGLFFLFVLFSDNGNSAAHVIYFSDVVAEQRNGRERCDTVVVVVDQQNG